MSGTDLVHTQRCFSCIIASKDDSTQYLDHDMMKTKRHYSPWLRLRLQIMKSFGWTAETTGWKYDQSKTFENRWTIHRESISENWSDSSSEMIPIFASGLFWLVRMLFWKNNTNRRKKRPLQEMRNISAWEIPRYDHPRSGSFIESKQIGCLIFHNGMQRGEYELCAPGTFHHADSSNKTFKIYETEITMLVVFRYSWKNNWKRKHQFWCAKLHKYKSLEEPKKLGLDQLFFEISG